MIYSMPHDEDQEMKRKIMLLGGRKDVRGFGRSWGQPITELNSSHQLNVSDL